MSGNYSYTYMYNLYHRDSEKQPSFDGSELKLPNDVDLKDPPGPNVLSVEMSHDVPPAVKKNSDVSHDCGKECWVYGTECKTWQMYSPLDIPLKLGWKRYRYMYVYRITGKFGEYCIGRMSHLNIIGGF